MKACIVTGGSGFVGLTLVRRLLAEGCAVTVFDLNDPGEADVTGTARFVRGDVRDAAALREAARGADSFFHLAAMVPLTRAGRAFEDVNVGGTANAVEAALAAGVDHFVHLSSSAIYGVPRVLPVTETTPPTPFGRYGKAKLAGERLAQQARGRGLRVAVIRPRTIVGPGRLGIFDILFDWIHHGTPVFMLGSVNRPFQLLSNRDLAGAMVLASRARADGEFNVGAGSFRSLREDLDDLAQRVGSRSRVLSIPAWLGRPGLQVLDWLRLSPLVDWHYKTIDKEFWFDNARPRAELGWEPQDSNIAMLCEAFQWYLDNRTAARTADRSVHRSPLRRGLLSLLDPRGSR